MKAKIQRHMIDEDTVRLHEAVSDGVYVQGTVVAPEGKLTAVLDKLAQPEEWVSEKAGITIGKCINTSYNLTDYAAAWIWTWPVKAGEKVQLSINQFTGRDSDDGGYGCDVGNYDTINQCTWTVYDSADPANWTAAHKIANGKNLRDVTYRGTSTEEIVIPEGGVVLVASGYVSTNLRFGTDRTAELRPCTGFRLERKKSLGSGLKKLKILAVGNSYSCDELSYLPYVMRQVCPDVELTLRILYRSSGSLAEWADNKDATAVSGREHYWWEWKEFPGRWNRKTKGGSATLRSCVEADDWDIITLQQVSSGSVNYSTIESALTDIVGWLRTEMKYGGKIGWLLTHAWPDANLSPSSSYGADSDAMFAKIATACKSVMNSGLVDLLIPSGTAVQNARHTSLGDTKSLKTNNDIHLWEGCGPLAAACAACGAIMAKLTPVKVQLASWWAIPGSQPDNVEFNTYMGTNGELAGMDATSQAIAVQCAVNALLNPYEITKDLAPVAVTDNLNSTSAKDALSANQGRELKKMLDEYCPIIEDTRTSAVAAITGVAPFDTLEDGQRIVLKMKYSTTGTNPMPTLELSLNNNTTTGQKALYFTRNNALQRIGVGNFQIQLANSDNYVAYIGMTYSISMDGWFCDYNYWYYPQYSTITQAEITAGTSTSPRMVTPKLLVDNFEKRRLYVDNSADASVELSVTTYNDLGTLTAWKPVTLPAAYNRGDEFVFRFECGDADLLPALPAGVVLADGFDFSEMAVGVTYQVSIMDGVAAYLTITPNS